MLQRKEALWAHSLGVQSIQSIYPELLLPLSLHNPAAIIYLFPWPRQTVEIALILFMYPMLYTEVRAILSLCYSSVFLHPWKKISSSSLGILALAHSLNHPLQVLCYSSSSLPRSILCHFAITWLCQGCVHLKHVDLFPLSLEFSSSTHSSGHSKEHSGLCSDATSSQSSF